PIDAIAFTANRAHPFYAGQLSFEQTAQAIAGAEGPLGSCSAYLEETALHLRKLGIPDPSLERLHTSVTNRLLRPSLELIEPRLTPPGRGGSRRSAGGGS